MTKGANLFRRIVERGLHAMIGAQSRKAPAMQIRSRPPNTRAIIDSAFPSFPSLSEVAGKYQVNLHGSVLRI